jgi:Retrotransposon gag protein
MRAAIFATRAFTHKAKNGLPLYPSWKDFTKAFRQQFFHLHEATNTMNQLESRQYHQGKHSIEEYIDGLKSSLRRQSTRMGGRLL